MSTAVLVAAVVAVGGVAAALALTDDEESLTIVLIHHFRPSDASGIGIDAYEPGSSCGVSGLTRRRATFAFLEAGTDVLLKSGQGKILARTALPVGEAVNPRADLAEFDCEWELRFVDVPPAAVYQIEVAGHVVATLSRFTPAVERNGEIVVPLQG